MNYNLEQIFQEQTPLVQIIKDANQTTMTNLITASLPLIQIINNLINKTQDNHTANIEHTIFRELTEFEAKLWAAEYSKATVYTSRIILCDWAKQALQLHQTNPGPMQTITNFDNIQASATQIIQSIDDYIEVAELISICISLGYTNPAINQQTAQQIYQLVRSNKLTQPNTIHLKNNLITQHQSFKSWKIIAIIPLIIIIYIIYYVLIKM